MRESSDLDFLQQHLSEMPEFVLPVTLQREGTAGIDPTGSAVLARAGDTFFVISAAHTLRTGNVSPLIHGSKGGARLRQVVVLYDKVGRLGVDVDLAYAEISETLIRKMGVGAALDLSTLNLDEVGAAGDSYVAIGYPVSRSKVRTGQRKMANTLTHLTLNSEPATRYEQLGISQRSHLLLTYDRKEVAPFGGERSQGIHPRGMSGGIILRPFRNHRSASGVDADAVGILTEYRERDGSLLIASRLHFVTESMRSRYPHLRRHLPVSEHSKVTFSSE